MNKIHSKKQMKVAIVMPDDFSLWQPRRGFLKWLVDHGYDVYGITSDGPYVERIESLGVKHIAVAMERFIDPSQDIRYLIKLYRIFRHYNFDIVHNMTTKPNIYGAIAAKLAGVPRIVGSVEGLGQALADGAPNKKARLTRWTIMLLYRLACGISYKMRFMNNDDRHFFLAKGLINSRKAVLVVGEGVNLAEYNEAQVDRERSRSIQMRLSINHNGTRFITMVARANWLKGVREFVEASEIVGRSHENVKFLLVGTIDGGNQSVPREYLESRKSSHFEWLGFIEDLREIFIFSDLVVLPSYMREGVPNSLIEAMAMGKPIVTTDNVGCREVVIHGKNGCLVPVRDTAALAGAINELLEDSNKLSLFGRESRLRVEREFDERIVFSKIVNELYS